MSGKFLKYYHIALWIVLIAMLIPMCAAAFYNRPTVDDLYQPFAAMKAVENGGGLWEVLLIGLQKMSEAFFNGCGTFLTMFLSFIPPMVAGYQLAWIHPIVFMLFLCGACFRAAYCVRAVNPAMPRAAVHCAAILTSVMLLNLLPSISEGIYWYSGAVNYTFTFALSVYLFSSLFSMEIRRGAGVPLSWARLALLCVGFFLLGGGNFSTSTVSVSLYALYVLYLFVCKKDKRTALPFLFMAAGFLLAVLSPGNALRQAGYGTTYPLPQTFLRSFHEAFQMTFADMRIWVFALLFVPVILAVLPYLPLKYRHAPLLALMSWALLAASIVPVMYAYASTGAARQLNTHFFLCCFLIVINLAYFMGLCRRWLLERYALRTANGADGARTWDRAAFCWTAAVCILFGGLTLRNLEFRPGIVLNMDLPGIKAVSYLRDGSLKAYSEVYDEMVAQAKANPGGDVTVSAQPTNDLFGSFVITSDANDWYNQSFASYYGCGSIVFVPDDPAEAVFR